MLPDRVSSPGPLTYESGALPIGLRGPALAFVANREVIYLITRIQESSADHIYFIVLLLILYTNR